MQYQEVAEIIKNVPHMTPEQGQIVYDFVKNSDIKNILELGFAHGTSTCYMAAALDEKKSGLITTIDRQGAEDREPNIFTLLSKTKLSSYVKPIFADTSYNWELKKLIEDNSTQGVCQPIFDFCFIDGAHSWEVDGLAYFLAEKLLKPGGWILFDDFYWTFNESPSLKNVDWVKQLPKEQKVSPQIERVFSLLVCQNPNFENFKVVGNWGWAQKKASSKTANRSHNLLDEVYSQQSIKTDIISILRKVKRRIKSGN